MELLIIGLDGLSENMLDRFDVELPYLESVRTAGVSGDLMSVDTPTTIPAWTSFATGKDPGSHGTATMVQQSPEYDISPASPNTTDAAIYDFLDDSLFVNLPASNGRVPMADGTKLVSAMLAKDEREAVPASLQSLDAFDDYVLDHDASLKVTPNRYREHVHEVITARERFAREAFETHEPTVGFVLFSATDWAGHILGNLSTDSKQRTFYADIVRHVDDAAAELATLADNVLLMSDHGFERKHTNAHLNEWMESEGYFEQQSSDSTLAEVVVQGATAIARRSDRLYALLRRLHNHLMGTRVGAKVTAAARPNVDHSASRAWQLRYGCVFINDDRFSNPTVEDGESLVQELKAGISDLTDEDGEPLFRDVLRAAEAYANPAPMAPDIVARPAPGVFPTNLLSPTGGHASVTDNYEHRYRGLFAATGPMFSSGTASGVTIVDILPTVLAGLNERISPHFDGRAQLEMLETETAPAELPVEDVPSPAMRRDHGPDEEREHTVEGRLEDLGYIE